VARKGEEVERGTSEAKGSQSFTMNLFRGVFSHFLKFLMKSRQII
jgi:hypothetical protein